MLDLEQLRFTKTHEWIRLEGAKAVVGITDHAQKEISEIVFVELPKVGKKVNQAEEMAVVESVKAAFSIYAPIAGAVVRVNDLLSKDPGVVNRSPYGEGWIAELESADPRQAGSLMTAGQYEAWVQGEGKH